jgi:hypothetical protein
MRRGFISLTAALGALALGAPAAVGWAPAERAKVHPGVMTYTAGAQCTANFIFRDGRRTFIGQAAHCSGTGAATDTDGCDSRSRPLGTRVRVEGAKQRGRMVYNSWIAMQRDRERRDRVCLYNDFALVKLRAGDVRRTNPSLPGYGGPTRLGVGREGQAVYSWGNSSLRGGVEETSPREGRIVARVGGGWGYEVYTATPGVPGDSGSGFLNRNGGAMGVLSTLNFLPTPGSNGVSDLRRALAYARNHSRFDRLRLIRGTEPFDPDTVGAIGGR